MTAGGVAWSSGVHDGPAGSGRSGPDGLRTYRDEVRLDGVGWMTREGSDREYFSDDGDENHVAPHS